MNIILCIEKNIVIVVIRTRNVDKKKKLNHSCDLKKSKKKIFFINDWCWKKIFMFVEI